MATWPATNTYLAGQVLTATNMNDVGNAINTLGFTAGKNKIINGDFGINQRNFTSNTAAGTYNFDRWLQNNGGASGTLTVTPQVFTAGAAPVSGYESANFVQCVTASGAAVDTYAIYSQKIEDVRTCAGQTVIISFWAKATSGTPKIAIEFEQLFGSGGSPSTGTNTAAGAVTLSNSWARYSIVASIPSISGKTIGTTANSSSLSVNMWLSAGTNFSTRASSIGLQNATFQIWGVQLEAFATTGYNGTLSPSPFQTATGTKQGELAACQRYYVRTTAQSAYGNFAVGYAQDTGTAVFPYFLPVTMRTSPTSLDISSSIVIYDSGFITGGTWSIGNSNTNVPTLTYTKSASFTQYRPYRIIANNDSAGYIGLNAEL